MTTLERVRAEIADNHDFYFFAESNKDIALGLEYALDIIDKYAEQEPTGPCDLCGFNTGEFCGYLGECPAIEKAVSK